MIDLVEAVPDCLLFDTDQKLTRPNMLAAWAAGARGMLRYVGYEEEPFADDLDAQELEGLLETGFGVMVVQHVRAGLWLPTAAMGTSDGRSGVKHAQAAGIKAQVTFWDDLESIGGTGQATVDYANAKYDAVVGMYSTGEYIGEGVPLSGTDLFNRLLSPRYWRSMSDVPDVTRRGYCMQQLRTSAKPFSITIGGVEYDVNAHTADKLGGRAMWMRRAA